MKPIKKFLFFFLLFALTLALGKWGIGYVRAVSCGDSCSDPQSCQAVADECTKQISLLQSQANTLSNQIAQFNAQIYLTTLKIQQTEDKITLLGGRIDQLEISLNDLTKAFSSRAVETYKMYRIGDPFMILVSATDLSDAVSRFHYLQKIEEADRDLLNRLQTAQTDYKNQKATQEQLQTELQTEENYLNNQKAAKANLLAATQNDEAKYQQLLARARAELESFRGYSFGRTSTAPNQTVHDDWGYYYAQGDPEWGNTFLAGSSIDTVASSGCLITSSAMIATHYGKSLNPGDMAQTPSADWLSFNVIVNGITISRESLGADPGNTNTTINNIDSELSNNRPVIVGLFSSCSDIGCFPKHFIVLRSGSNGNYIMNDPLGKDDGYNKPFTSQYNLSDITDVEKVSVY